MANLTQPPFRDSTAVQQLTALPGRVLLVLGMVLAAPVAAQAAVPAPVQWLRDDEVAIARARKTGEPVVADFWPVRCSARALLERSTFSDPRFRKALDTFEATLRSIPDRGRT